MDHLPHKLCKNLKTYVENVSKFILKEKFGPCQLAGVDPAEIVVPLTATLSLEKADQVMTHLLEFMNIMGIHVQLTEDAAAQNSKKLKQFFAYYNIKYNTGI